MIRGLYTSASGMMAEQARNDITANNLANVNTTGYKKDTTIFKSFPEMLLNRIEKEQDSPTIENKTIGKLGTGVIIDEVKTMHTQGQIKESSNPLDMAILGEGFFVIETPAGERYTRNGNFTLDREGYLVTSEGHYVMGQQGPIQLNTSDVIVDKQGNLLVDGTVLDTLRVVTFNDNGNLTKEGNSLFVSKEVGQAFNGQVQQKALETSNVNPVAEMVNMITIMRAYEANQKMISAHDQTLGQAINEVGRVR